MDAVGPSLFIAKMIIVSVRPTPSSRPMSLPSRSTLVVPSGTWKVGTGVGMPPPIMNFVPVNTAKLGTIWGWLVGVREGTGVFVGRGVRVVVSTSSSGSGLAVALVFGVLVAGNWVGGSAVAVLVSVEVAEGKITSATADGTRVGVGSSVSPK